MKLKHWYTLCKKHFDMNFNPRRDAWCKAAKETKDQYPCGVRSEVTGFCKKRVYAEFYPNLIDLARRSQGYRVQKRRK